MITLNSGQSYAVKEMEDFLKQNLFEGREYYILSGAAGTGKTQCVKELARRVKGKMVFTAPTNKATRVLQSLLKDEDFDPTCKTTYQLLELKMEPDGNVRKLTEPEDPVDLSDYLGVVVDEASMVSEGLLKHIRDAAKVQGVKFIFVGDMNQLPPVGEASSQVWGVQGEELTSFTILNKVMRNDSYLLEFANKIKEQISHPAPSIKIESKYDCGTGGVVVVDTRRDFEEIIKNRARTQRFSEPSYVKVIAWRNTIVAQYNEMVREALFDEGVEKWVRSDRIILTEPALDRKGRYIATTDAEGTITSVKIATHEKHPEYTIWELCVTLDTNEVVTLQLLHESCESTYKERLDELAAIAKIDRRKWRDFWKFKESFHQAKHAYAITAHRAQGSTYHTAFVDWRDILSNRNRSEAFRCLYTACTRPSTWLYMTR